MASSSTSHHRRGALHELVAAQTLGRLGWDIFFPLLHTSPIDFIAVRGPTVQRVQVKTAYWACTTKVNSKTGHWYLMTRTGIDGYKKNSFDTLMVVGPKGEVWSIPWSVAFKHKTIYFDARHKNKYRPRRNRCGIDFTAMRIA